MARGRLCYPDSFKMRRVGLGTTELYLERIILDKCLEAECREKPLEKSELDPYGADWPSRLEKQRFIKSAKSQPRWCWEFGC